MFVYLNINYKKKTAKMSLLDTLQTVKFHISSVETSLTELEKGRKAAAPRARKSIQASRQLLSELRKLIMLNLKALPVNKRINLDLKFNQRVKTTDTSPTPPPTPEVLIPEVLIPEVLTPVDVMRLKRKYVKRSIKKVMPFGLLE